MRPPANASAARASLASLVPTPRLALAAATVAVVAAATLGCAPSEEKPPAVAVAVPTSTAAAGARTAGVPLAAPAASGVSAPSPPAAATPPAAAAAPARIVSLAPSVTETLFALGAGPRVVGISDYCDYPPAAQGLPRVGSFLTPSVEAVIALRPDLVIGTESPGNRGAVETLRRLGVRVEILEAQRLADLAPTIRAIARLAGVPAEGERVLAGVERALAEVRARLEDAPPRRVLMVVGQAPLIAVGHRSFLGDLIEEARGVNVAPGTDAWPHLNVEYVIAADPEVIVDSSMGTEQATATLTFWEQFESVAAVRAGRVHPFRSYAALRPGPRLGGALAELARLIHPERWR